MLDYPQKKVRKDPVDWDSFVIPGERGKNVDEYMREMRENDRLSKGICRYSTFYIFY